MTNTPPSDHTRPAPVAPARAGATDPGRPDASRTPASGQAAWRVIALLGGSQAADSTPWRVTTILGVAQLCGLVVAVLGGLDHLAVLRGAQPHPRVAPLRARTGRIGTAAVVLVALTALVWIVVEPGAWLTTLALGLVAAQSGPVLRVAAAGPTRRAPGR